MPSRLANFRGILSWSHASPPERPTPGPGDPGPVDPGWGIEAPVDPGYGMPTLPPHISNELPDWLPEAPGRPVHLPVFPYDPTHPIAGKPPGVATQPPMPTNPIAPGGAPPVPTQPPMPSNPIALGSHFVLGWTAHYGFVLYPAADATTPTPKAR